MARSFNGSSDYGVHSALAISAYSCSFSCWFNTSSAAGNVHLLTLGTTSGAARVLLYLNLGKVVAGVSGSPDINATTSTSYSTGVWNHACGVFTGSGIAVYLNGAGKGTSSTNSFPAGMSRTYLGVRYNSGIGGYFPGSIAVPAVHNIALSDAEAATLASGRHPSVVQPSALVALWALTGASPEPDSIGGFDFTMTGTTHVSDPPLNYGSGNPVYYNQQQAAVAA